MLPGGKATNHETVRKQLPAIAERIEAELDAERLSNDFESQQELGEQPLPDGLMSVGIDGWYARGAHKHRVFEVIAGRSVVAFRQGEGIRFRH